VAAMPRHTFGALFGQRGMFYIAVYQRTEFKKCLKYIILLFKKVFTLLISEGSAVGNLFYLLSQFSN